tara:strand:+ start:582 stop:761 length:180 start_codon:yes stop_codon:yes gene_type:complete
MTWFDLVKASRKRCTWCGNPKGWNGKDCISCNRGDFDDTTDVVETYSDEAWDESMGEHI